MCVCHTTGGGRRCCNRRSLCRGERKGTRAHKGAFFSAPLLRLRRRRNRRLRRRRRRRRRPPSPPLTGSLPLSFLWFAISEWLIPGGGGGGGGYEGGGGGGGRERGELVRTYYVYRGPSFCVTHLLPSSSKEKLFFNTRPPPPPPPQTEEKGEQERHVWHQGKTLQVAASGSPPPLIFYEPNIRLSHDVRGCTERRRG